MSPDSKSSIVFLSTYPPRECGIATFTQDLVVNCAKILGERIQCKVAAFNVTPLDTYKYPEIVEWEVNQNSKEEYIKLAKKVNTSPKIKGVILQHEYGIFGGVEGDKILHFMQNCNKPILTTLHTILPFPNEKMKEVTSNIIKLSRIIIVLTNQSKKIVEEVYPEAVGKVTVIPHGIHQIEFATPEKYKEKLELEKRLVISTFGLLSRGKGIEYMIKALPPVIKKYPSLLYLVLGETHPVVRRNEGEEYRIRLIRLVNRLGLQKHVKFYDQYMSLPNLFTFLKATDIYIATSINPNQAVSGTLSYALGSGRAVISTQFAQAKEIVTPDIGRLVPIKKTAAYTAALLDLLSDKNRLLKMHKGAYERTRYMLWSNVAQEYLTLLKETFVPFLKIDHLKRMTDEFGMFQFARLSTPNTAFGYTLDDNARALIVSLWLAKRNYQEELSPLIHIYFRFMKQCFKPDGVFLNYISYKDRSPTSQNSGEILEDTQGRALWALSEVMQSDQLSTSVKNEAKEMFLKALAKSHQFIHLRAQAYVIKACALALSSLPEQKNTLLSCINHYAKSLESSYGDDKDITWNWFENNLSYNNAVLSEAMFIAGNCTNNTQYTEVGSRSLQFLIEKTFTPTFYQPIGNEHWHKKNQEKSLHDQQPEDPASMMLALSAAYTYSHDKKYIPLMQQCFSWFLGNNSSHISLYDSKTGGCFDGLLPDRVNLNQGAESLISYLMSWSIINEITNSK
jgi:glycosyltransferase involved in cell wall biosynthesis